MKIEQLTPSNFVNEYYKPGLGSMRYSLAGVSARVGPDPEHLTNDPLIRARLDRALASSDHAADLQYQWMSHQRLEPLRRQGVMTADNVVDRSVTALYDNVDSMRRLSPSNPRHQDASALLDALMPLGPGVITGQKFEEEHSAVNVLLRRLDNDFQPLVQRLGLEPFVEELREANQTYARELSSLNNAGVPHSQVNAAFEVAKNDFFAVILTIWAVYLDDQELRNKILAPVHEQHERLRIHYQTRKSAPRVNPQSGELLDDETTTISEAELILDRELPALHPVEDPRPQPTDA